MKSKQLKQEEAAARNFLWRKKPLLEKAEILMSRPGFCDKQLKKLVKQHEIDQGLKRADQFYADLDARLREQENG